MKKKLFSRPVLVLMVLVLLVGSFGWGATMERAGLLPGRPYHEPESVRTTFSPFWETWDLVEKKYVDREAVDPTRMTYGAIEGLLQALGDEGHTRFLSPKELHAQEEAITGQLEGIGCEMGVRDGRPTVVAPIAGSPAQKAGIRPGDIFLRVDGRDVTALPLDELIPLVRGPAGTKVTVNTDFDTTWQWKNIGTRSWEVGYVDLRYDSGQKMQTVADVFDISTAVAPGAETSKVVDMRAPATAGKYTATWKLAMEGITLCTMTVSIEAVNP